MSFSTATPSFFRADTQTTTSIAVHAPYVYTVSKDKTLIKWELATPTIPTANKGIDGNKTPPKKGGARQQRKKPRKVNFVRGMQKVAESGEEHGHTGRILSVAVSPSGKFIVTGGTDRKLIIWDSATLKPQKTFMQHRDSISSLAFTRHISTMSSGEQLFSGSFDRTIKTWSLSSAGHAYVETLFGHQDNVASVAAMTIDQCVSVGARDRTARLWKVVDESQLVFRGGSSKNAQYHEHNLDCVAPLPPTHFVTGSDSGAISLWSIHKKKPLHTILLAHGLDPIPPLDQLSSEQDMETARLNARHLRPTPRWITALATLPGTDIVLSGSWDGWIRAWKISEDKKIIESLGPVGGNNSDGANGVQQTTTTSSPSLQLTQSLVSETPNGNHETNRTTTTTTRDNNNDKDEPLIKGVVNDIAVFERRPTQPSTTTTNLSNNSNSHHPNSSNSNHSPSTEETQQSGLCILAAVGKEHRLGRWNCFANNLYTGPSSNGRNGAMVFEVSFSHSS